VLGMVRWRRESGAMWQVVGKWLKGRGISPRHLEVWVIGCLVAVAYIRAGIVLFG
jgi:hypothetical protein